MKLTPHFNIVRLLVLGLALTLLPGCVKKSHDHAGHDHDHDHDHGAAKSAHSHGGHEHVAPHGGTAIELGEEAFHVELVLDAEQGLLTAYVLDGELENFIRCDLERIQILVTEPVPTTLNLLPVANPATGETVGQTSQYEVRADWLRAAPRFSAEISQIRIRGQVFEKVAFRFPEGNH